jgi:CheY-like chemotaxis protein
MHLLVVDDNSACAFATASLLRLYGYDADVALSGEDALSQAAGLAPDLVLLDLALPGTDGFEVARRLQPAGRGKAPLIVALTGHGTDEDRKRAAAAGVHIHLLKPVDPAVLLRLLRQFRAVAGE